MIYFDRGEKMISILIEPTCLDFKLAVNNMNFIDLGEEIIEFKSFTKELQELFKNLEENRMRIAVTKELLDIYLCSVPISVYNAQHPLHRLAIEVYTNKLKRLVKVVHKFGDHALEVSFDDSGLMQDNQIYSSDAYLHWNDMSGLIFKNKLPAIILKANRLTIFRENTIFICETGGNRIEVILHNKLSELSNSREIRLYRLAQYVQTAEPSMNIPCCGTGTHSSMWGNSIREINDIPHFERELIKKLMDTGLIKSIKFLAFDKKLDSVGSPLIVVNRIEEKTNAVLLMCTLRGQGVKQHCQEIVIEVEKDFAIELVMALDHKISIDKLDSLFLFNAAMCIE